MQAHVDSVAGLQQPCVGDPVAARDGFLGNARQVERAALSGQALFEVAPGPRPFMVETEAQEAFRRAMGPGGMGGGDEE